MSPAGVFAVAPGLLPLVALLAEIARVVWTIGVARGWLGVASLVLPVPKSGLGH